jgi:hypothetical protein
MQSELFNSVFEMELRVLLLLSSGRRVLFSADRIVNLDFIACYAERFLLPYENLHGDNDYMYGELANRRSLVNAAIRTLVMKGLIDITIDGGFLYSISESGKKYVKSLKSDYATEYREISTEAIKVFKKMSDSELDGAIHSNAIRSLGGR